MSNKTKKGRPKVIVVQDRESKPDAVTDVRYLASGGGDAMSLSSIVNGPAAASDDRSAVPAALLAVDCEAVSRPQIALATSKVADDSVVLEMTVTSEFTLVGCHDDDENLPDDDVLDIIMESSEKLFPTRKKREKGSLLGMRNVGKTEDGGSGLLGRRRRGRPRKDEFVDEEDDSEDLGEPKPFAVVQRRNKIQVSNEAMYQCPECKRSFPSAFGLKLHMAAIHVADRGHTCFVCGDTFTGRKALRTHVATHSSAKNNVCADCGRWYKDRKVLNKHAARHRGDDDTAGKIVDCGMCAEEFQTESELADHVVIHLSEMPLNLCLVCGRHLAPMSSMEKHLRTHTGAKMAACPVCAREFAEAYNLKSHMRIHTGERPFTCPQCHRRFTSVSTLKNHVLVHSGVKNYVCTECPKRFRRSSHLAEHRRSHTGEKPYCCMHCGKAYTTSTALKSHLTTHANTDRHKCPVCEFVTPRYSSLRKHARTHELCATAQQQAGVEERRYMCADCGRRFARIANMEKHVEMHRARREAGLEDFAVDVGGANALEKVHACAECGRMFARHRNMVKHALTHQGDDVELKLDELDRPIRRIGDKPFVCAECGRPFARIGNMQKHFLTHWNQEMEDDTSDG